MWFDPSPAEGYDNKHPPHMFLSKPQNSRVHLCIAFGFDGSHTGSDLFWLHYFFLSLLQRWLQHQGAAGFCGTARVCRPQLGPSPTVSRGPAGANPDLRPPDVTAPPPPPLIAGSSCGASVCQAKPRRSTAWWRRLPRGTASATPESFSRQVRADRLGCFHDTTMTWNIHQLWCLRCFIYTFWNKPHLLDFQTQLVC